MLFTTPFLFYIKLLFAYDRFICYTFIRILFTGGLVLAQTDNFKSIKEAVAQNGIYTGLTSGTSMEPLIHHQKDTIIVVKQNGRLKKYDIPVYMSKSGKYIMHRVVKVCGDHYVIVGDNLLNREYVTDDMIVGVLKSFYKNGKKYIDLETNKAYKLYSRIWVALLPLRPLYVYPKRAINKIKRIIKRGIGS